MRKNRINTMDIELRIPTIDDKEGLKALCNAVDRTYLSDRMPYPYTDEDAEWWISMVTDNEGINGVWRVIYYDGKLVGNISVEKKSGVYHKDAELGYCLLTEYWSRGIMTEAARRICRIAFDNLDIIRITGEYYEPNAASGRVMEKAGFSYEGTRKSAVIKGDNVYDLCMTGLMREKFEEEI